jgi:orotidine-5'-phosphate decarboxylase
MNLGLSTGASAQPAVPNDTVLVLQTVQTDYSDPAVVRDSVAKAIPAQTTVKPREGLSNVISRLYSVGQSNAPEAYAKITSTIQNWNNLSDKAELMTGQVLIVPDLPKIARSEPNHQNPLNAIPKLSLDLRTSNLASGLPSLDTKQVLDESQRLGAKAVVMVHEMSSTQAKATLSADSTAIVAEAPLHLRFLQGAAGGTPVILSAADTRLIRAAAARPTLQRPVMIVFDDTWPDRNAEESARTYVLNAVQTLRTQYNLPPMQAFDAECQKATPASAWPGHAVTVHAAQIEEALKPLVDAAGANSPITLVYLPTLAGGLCVDEVLGQLIELHLLTRHLGAQLGQGAPASLVAKYHQITQSILAKLRTQFDANGGDSDVETISAVLDFARRYGAAINQPVFTSMSWEFKYDDWQPLVPSEYGGLFVVAAGNDGSAQPVTITKAQFAERSAHPGDMLAVMNVDSSGHFTCQTSVVDPTSTAFATSFNGWLSPQACGTSFSAPRVAWLLALRESKRPPLHDLTDLSAQIREDLRSQGMSTVTTNGGRPLDLATLLH